jgi:FAD-linked sulfhydryl oxidase
VDLQVHAAQDFTQTTGTSTCAHQTTMQAEEMARAWYKAQEQKKLGNATERLMAALVAPQVKQEKGKKKCRVCSEFEQWGEAATKEKDDTGKENLEGVPVISKRGLICPPDSQQLGRATWTFLHTMAAFYPEKPTRDERENASGFLHAFSKLYPCSYCAKHLQEELKSNTPKVASRTEFTKWMCDLHNEVNVRLGKPVFDCERVDERWLDGPDDCQ